MDVFCKSFLFYLREFECVTTELQKIPTKATSQVQEDASPKQARIEITLPGNKSNAAATLDTQHSGHNRLHKWLISAHQQMSIIVTDLNSLEHAIKEVSVSTLRC